MYDVYIIKILAYYDELKITISVIFGALVQFVFSENKNFGLLLTIGLSSIFVAIYIISPLVEVYNLSPGSQIVVAFYAISSLISVPLIGIVLLFLPETIRAKIKTYIGIKK